MRANTPRICKGKECQYLGACMTKKVVDVDKLIGKKCPDEEHFQNAWTGMLCEELGIKENDMSMIQRRLVAQLVKYDIYERRTEYKLATEDFITKQTVHVDDDGVIYDRDELNQAVTFEESLDRRRMRALNALIATPEAKKKLGGEELGDPSSVASELMQKGKRMLQEGQDLAFRTARKINAEDDK